MKKKEKMIIAIVAALVLVIAAGLFVINNYRGDDGLTYSERKQLEENGEAVVDWDAMEEAQEEEGFFARLFNNKDKSDDSAETAKDTDKNKETADNKSDKSASDKEKETSGTDTDKGSDKDSADNKDDNSSDNDETDKEETTVNKPTGTTEYEKYMAMSPEQQEAYYETFDSPEAFISWLNKAKAEYESIRDSVEVEGGGIDIGDYQ